MVEIKTIKITPTIKVDFETYMKIGEAAVRGKNFMIKAIDAHVNIETKEILLKIELELEW